MKHTLFIFIAIIFFGCSSSDNEETNPPENPVLTSIDISSSNGNELDLNGISTATLTVVGRDQFGQPITISGTVNWSASNSNVSINQNGNVTAISVGNSVISASIDNISNTFSISVIETTPILTSLDISSSNGNELDLNGTNTTTFTVIGRDQFGQPMTISGTINWSASNGNVSIDQSGNLTAISVGNSVISASIDAISDTFNICVIDTTPVPGTYIYVSDAGNFNNPPWQILRYDENGENPVVFISENQGLSWPQDIIFLEDQNEVLISNLSSGTINRHNATTGDLISSFATGISGPTRMKIGDDNLLYVLQWGGNGKVLRYQLDGTYLGEFTNFGVTQAIGLDWDLQGNLYVSSFADATIRKFDSNGNSLGLFINSNLQGPTNIWFDSSSNLIVIDWSGGVVAKFDSNGNFDSNIISGLSQAEGVDFFPNGDFIIGNGGTSEVKLYDSAGNFNQNFISAGVGGLLTPNAVRIRVIN